MFKEAAPGIKESVCSVGFGIKILHGRLLSSLIPLKSREVILSLLSSMQWV